MYWLYCLLFPLACLFLLLSWNSRRIKDGPGPQPSSPKRFPEAVSPPMSREGSHSSQHSFPILSSTLDRIRECTIKHAFIPRSIIDAEINEKAVQDILAEKRIDSRVPRAKLAEKIVQRAQKLFTILVMSKKVDHINTFMDRGIQDSNLPFKLDGNVLRTSQGHEVPVPEDWDYEDLEALESKQWRVLVPVFRQGAHYDFPEQQKFPFVGKESAKSTEGGYGRVSCERIHADHHNFCEPPDSKSQGCRVAVKKLIRQDITLFQREKEFLEALGSADPHPHLINLLCTYSFQGDNHLVFPWADENLREYWKRTKLPQWNSQNILWWVKQVVGIASGLSVIHKLPQAGKTSSKTLYGRHGDLKPENIIWFKKRPGCTDQNGILMIADLGLAKLHRFESKSNDLDAAFPQTYSPPRRPGEFINRAFDIWGLGCLYLELATYIICGEKAIGEFAELRGSDDPNYIINTDCFYSVDQTRVRPSIDAWVTRLKTNPRCSPVLSDLLDLIMSRMIRIESRERSSAQTVYRKLDKMYKKAKSDPQYLLGSYEMLPQQELDNSQEPTLEASPSAQNVSHGSSSTYFTPKAHSLGDAVHNARPLRLNKFGPDLQSKLVVDSDDSWSMSDLGLPRSRGTWPQVGSS
ncbi:protein kinase domain-containing protein [Aspergillus nomiae NRRL 13137]|uniref:Protein kinase domain-containing protein n=1 Tax=Aspergillus nomiae NRRL (strain ATCC 15546 / NRRL 13137 / CBS 260.88 / M93) TaxID=1509407 RepID=A0A0L1IZU3_ASPN3|nr:protein kinase domain-containing protein [Aspergillus nomiae NRRL 13137]KNG85034.1 protein kinase domain-containing protein [Aspergillus nomiae NRRL 13137]